MIVYADVLIFLNTLVNYFLLLATAKLSGHSVKTIRIVLSSVLGGVSCLYIFLPPQPITVELFYKSAVAIILCAVCFGFSSVKALLKEAVILFLITCAYAGVMFAFWHIFRPFGMVINNSVVYFNISPVILVGCSGFGYLLFSVLSRIFTNSSKLAERCEITVVANGREVRLKAIADTGNSLDDSFGKSEVIIADKAKVCELFGTTDFIGNDNLKRRYRLLPCSTVSGFGSLDSFRCDSAMVDFEGGQIILQKPLLAISNVALNDDYNAIINPKILR